MSNDRIVIVGAGQAAIQTAHNLRAWGHEGPVTLIGEEASPAYQRPPLSKAYLKGELLEEKLFLKPAAFYDQKDVQIITGVRVQSVDRKMRTIHCDDDVVRSWDKLVLATGARPRMLPDLMGTKQVMALRGIDDALALRDQLPDIKHVTILGGGYIGLETAAVIRKMGIEVVVLEQMPRLLARVSGEVVADWFETLHAWHGVEIFCSARVDRFDTNQTQVHSLALADGKLIETDLLLLGIGVLPNMELASEAGLDCDNGIMVNSDGQTSDPDIYAIGDCSLRPLDGQADRVRIESVPNAIDQANIAAAHIVGRARPAPAVPWFWSDQYDTKIQTAGLLAGHDDYAVLGNPASGKFSVLYFKGGDFIAIDAVNDPMSFVAGKKVLATGLSLTRADLRDNDLSMMELVKTLMPLV